LQGEVQFHYVPDILYGTVGKLAGFFVFLTMTIFILLTFKYVEVTYRFPQGGGVVTVTARAVVATLYIRSQNE
jgi:hypothetical protein